MSLSCSCDMSHAVDKNKLKVKKLNYGLLHIEKIKKIIIKWKKYIFKIKKLR